MFKHLFIYVLALILKFQSTFTCSSECHAFLSGHEPLQLRISLTLYDVTTYILHYTGFVIYLFIHLVRCESFVKYELFVILCISPRRIHRTTIFAQMSTFARRSQTELFDWLILFYIIKRPRHTCDVMDMNTLWNLCTYTFFWRKFFNLFIFRRSLLYFNCFLPGSNSPDIFFVCKVTSVWPIS